MPDVLAPYKHYGTDVIEDATDGIITSADSIDDDAPADVTIKRWQRWIARIEQKYILLPKVRMQGTGWLGAVLKIIYNYGKYLLL